MLFPHLLQIPTRFSVDQDLCRYYVFISHKASACFLSNQHNNMIFPDKLGSENV